MSFYKATKIQNVQNVLITENSVFLNHTSHSPCLFVGFVERGRAAEVTMDNLDFSEEEIQQQLVLLGYTDVPKHRLREFKQDLEQLIQNGGRPKVATIAAYDRGEPGPPAFTKEKVRPCDVGKTPGSFFIHDEQRRTQVVSPRSNQDGCSRRHRGDLLESSHSAATLIPDTRCKHFIKRKVLRKREGQSLVCDESIYSQDSDCSSSLSGRLSELRLHEAENDKASVAAGHMEEDSLSTFGSFTTSSTRSRSESDFRTKPKSFIRPILTQQTIKKEDPVARYFQYKQLWDELKLPGEQDHRKLRWEIRERLAYRQPPPKARRCLAANSYVVPTEKKRSALRWEIRNLMAHPLPQKFTCRF
ncbi:centriolar and ciliogenesis-associated protein HYLS1 isoform X4 [Syngnathus scovelli]|uniref:centriolar and ciliogenesis-associated protein HYLS1 isoform X4 n=1 Tax=Syngnathus scovelli TaxID=161590 RepID=UPI00210FC656|nr:hydrolethalus syndrome protein 1 homolog isoform X4 [Syngnathus scovelli]